MGMLAPYFNLIIIQRIVIFFQILCIGLEGGNVRGCTSGA